MRFHVSGRPVVALLLSALPTTLDAQRLPDLRTRPDASIAEPFAHIAGVRELGDGRAIVTDQTEQQVRLVDFRTRSSRQLGRVGDGPGEYRFPMAPLAGAGDSTWIFDATQRRLHIIASDGRFVRSTLVPTSGPAASAASVRGTDARGRLYLEGNSFDRERGSFSDSVAVVRWEPTSGHAEVVTRVWGGGRVELQRPDGPVSLARGVTPFPHLDAWVALPDGGVAIVKHRPFRIDVIGASGTRREGTTIPYRPVAVSARDREAHRRRSGEVRSRAVGAGGRVGGMQQPGRQFSDNEFPREMPPFVARAVLVSPEGEIWIGRSHPGDAKEWHYDVYAASGSRLGAVTLPVGSAVVGFGRGTVYVARTDRDDELIYLERYRR
jgi:hypothetical protein